MMYFLTPPWLYYLIGLVVVVSLLVYWKREAIKQELRRWRAKEMSIGPAKFERQNKPPKRKSTTSKPGVRFGRKGDFSGARINGVAGRDIIRGGSPASGGRQTTPGVDFGGASFKEAEIKNIAGRDIIESNNARSREQSEEEDSNAHIPSAEKEQP